MAASIGTRNSSNALAKFWQKNAQNWALPIIGVLSFLAVWQLLSTVGLLKLPGPWDIISEKSTRELLIYPFYDRGGTDKGLFWQTLASFERVAKGYSLAAIVGVGLGVLVGTTPVIDKALDPLFQFLRTVPPLAWVPIALFVIFITAIWPILLNTAVGVKQIPQDYRNVARVLQISRQKYFFKILIPSALPYIFTGLRISIGLAWLAIIAAEIIMSGIVGIGFFIWNAYTDDKVGEVILALVYIGAVGLILDRAIGWIQHLIVPEEQK
jgi:bicarbonate transport system permease protein